MKIYSIFDEIFHKNCHMVVNVPREEFKEYLRKSHGVESETLEELFYGSQAMFLYNVGCGYYFIWLEEFNWTIKDQGRLSHEINHWIDRTFIDSDIPINYDNTEVRAYYYEYIMIKVYEKLKHLNSVKKGNENEKT